MGEPTCPQCGGNLESVGPRPSYLNADQWDSVKAGDWFCLACPSNKRGNRDLCYWNDDEVDPDPSTYSEAALRGLLDPEGCEGTDFGEALHAGLVECDYDGRSPRPTPRGHRLIAKAQAVADQMHSVACGCAECLPFAAWVPLVAALRERGRDE